MAARTARGLRQPFGPGPGPNHAAITLRAARYARRGRRRDRVIENRRRSGHRMSPFRDRSAGSPWPSIRSANDVLVVKIGAMRKDRSPGNFHVRRAPPLGS